MVIVEVEEILLESGLRYVRKIWNKENFIEIELSFSIIISLHLNDKIDGKSFNLGKWKENVGSIGKYV